MLKATPIVNDKIWIVENDGEKIATIMYGDDGKYTLKYGEKKESFTKLSQLKTKFGIRFVINTPQNTEQTKYDLNGYPCHVKPYNDMIDVKRKLYIFTTEEKSKSFYCAGYFLVKQNKEWELIFCPKLLTIDRYESVGPYETREYAEIELEEFRETESKNQKL